MTPNILFNQNNHRHHCYFYTFLRICDVATPQRSYKWGGADGFSKISDFSSKIPFLGGLYAPRNVFFGEISHSRCGLKKDSSKNIFWARRYPCSELATFRKIHGFWLQLLNLRLLRAVQWRIRVQTCLATLWAHWKSVFVFVQNFSSV